MGILPRPSSWTFQHFILHVKHAWAAKENPKVIISQAKWDLARACVVHLIPVSTTILILVLNLRGYYIGQDFSSLIKSETINLLLLQVAAKIHELFIGSSLALIVLQTIRYELLFGDGLPLGLLGSGLAFSNIQFFFTKEFYGAAVLWLGHQKSAKKFYFLLLLIVSGVTAMLAGPSSAVLLVPKSQPWPGGGSEFFLNGTTADFWPVDLTGDLAELRTWCNQNNSASLGVCPAAGYASLWEHWGRTNFTDFYRSDVRVYAKKLSGSTFYWPIHSQASQIPPRYAMGDVRMDEEPRFNTFLVLPHAAPVSLLQQLTTDWWSAVASQRGVKASEVDDRQAYSTSYSAITAVRCSQAQSLSLTASTIAFPSLQGRFDFAPALELNVSNLSFTPTEYLKFRWVQLPDEFGPLSIGGLFESPWTDNSSRTAVACSVQAGWVPAQVTTDEYSFWTGWYPWNVVFGDRVPFYNAVPSGAPIGKTNGRIALGETWLDLLTPEVNVNSMASRNPRATTIESILENAGLDTQITDDSTNGQNTTTEKSGATKASDGTRARLIEAIVSSVVVDGLSRYGSHRVYKNASDLVQLTLSTYERLPDFDKLILQGKNALREPNVPGESVTTLSATMVITGFSFSKTLAGALATCVLVVHLLMATTHMCWILYKGQTSNCWVLASELVALAYNSGKSVPCLANASAAIKKPSTFGRVAKIRVIQHPENSMLDRVELIFDDRAQRDGYKPVVEPTYLEEIAIDDRRTTAVSKASIGHAFTWSGPDGSQVFSSSHEPLVSEQRARQREKVQVGRAYG